MEQKQNLLIFFDCFAVTWNFCQVRVLVSLAYHSRCFITAHGFHCFTTSPGIQDGMAWLLSAIYGVPMGSTETAAATATKDGSDVSTVVSEGERTP